MFEQFPCPKCERVLRRVGKMTVGDADDPKSRMLVAVFQCPECLDERELSGDTVEMPLMFVVDDEGHAFDPENPEGLL